MKVPSERIAISTTIDRLAELVGADCHVLRLESDRSPYRPDGVLKAGRFVFVVEWKSVATTASIGSVVRDLRRHSEAVERAQEFDGPVILDFLA